MKLHKSFIAKFVQASLFSCLSFFAYAQDVNSEENKPLPLNNEGYEARKKSIADDIDKAVKDIKEKEEKLTYDTFKDNQFSLTKKENQNISGIFDTPNESGGSYLFHVGGGDHKVNNLKLINNTKLASGAEVFTDQWYYRTSGKPGVEHLAYIENNGNITGKGPNETAHAIYLHSSEDFYFKNKGKITSLASREHPGNFAPDQRNIKNVISSGNLILENEGSGSMLDKFNFYGERVTFLNKENALVSNSSIGAGTLIFSNKGVMGPRNDTPMTIDEFIKAGRGHYDQALIKDYIQEKYRKYEDEFYRDKFKKRDEFIAAKDEYIAKKYGTEKRLPYKDYKKFIDEYSSGPWINPYTPKDAISIGGIECYINVDGTTGCSEEMVETEELFKIDLYNFERSLKPPMTIDEFIKARGKEFDNLPKKPDKETKSNYNYYIDEFLTNTTKINTENLQGENTGTVSGTLNMKFKDGYFINSGSIDSLNVNAGKGLIVNRGDALLDIKDNGQDSDLLTVDLKHSIVLMGSSINRKSAPTRVIVNEDTNIAGVLKANGSNETLVVSRNKNSELHNLEAGMDKYVGFEHLEMQGKWAIKESDAKFDKSITFNEANVELADKKLISPEVTNTDSSTINVTSNAEVNGNFTNEGKVSLTGMLTTSGNVKNSGTIEFNNGLQGTKFVTSGDYTGAGEKSLLKMNVDASAGETEFDLLKVGGKASGTTKIAFMDPKKLEAKMKNRVKLVQTQSSDENAFSLVEYKYGRYKYKFYNVANDGGYSNWYLEQLPTFRKEVAGIVSGFAASQNLFTHTFHDRVAKDKLPEEHTAWVRVYHHNTKYQLNGVDSKADAHSDTLQLGYDALKYNKGTNKFTAGAYVSLGRQKSETYLVEDDERVRSISKGYSLGLYATWEKPNWYVDSWIQVNRLKTKVNTSDGRSDYKTTALQASLEAGYNKLLNKTDNYAYYVQPQGQVIYNHFHKPDMGEELDVLNPRYFVTRLGVRFYQQSLNHPNHGEPYLALNWWHHTNQTSVVTDEKAISIKGIKDLKNIEVGIDKWHITDNLSVWTNVGYYMGTHNYRDIRYNLGASYRF
ncbi:autotransporter outer membrane beta-barrel domain-containing protein [Haemophilus sp. oral taxon 851]|uniref:autotransporter family protein n=1 Tax=Haemophilus sp. oral taxon 851 TaxID=762964 RepID=UPI0002D2E4C4|nr:autotransporter outer membrane beta-barrel domain-containing protein [Haemophilus sp. oral taxon 851]